MEWGVGGPVKRVLCPPSLLACGLALGYRDLSWQGTGNPLSPLLHCNLGSQRGGIAGAGWLGGATDPTGFMPQTAP